jgi:hypothetical protein
MSIARFCSQKITAGRNAARKRLVILMPLVLHLYIRYLDLCFTPQLCYLDQLSSLCNKPSVSLFPGVFCTLNLRCIEMKTLALLSCFGLLSSCTALQLREPAGKPKVVHFDIARRESSSPTGLLRRGNVVADLTQSPVFSMHPVVVLWLTWYRNTRLIILTSRSAPHHRALHLLSTLVPPTLW